MSRYRKLTAICAAAALALGLAACGGGGSSTPPATTGDDTKKGTSMAPAPGSCTDAACVKLFADALTAAQNELAALRADPKSTQAQITAATNAVTAAQTALSTAQTALATYNAKQPPTYALKAMDDELKKTTRTTMPTEFGDLTDSDLTDDEIVGGKVTVETGTPAKKVYAKATWPVGMISDWKGSVWEKEGTDTKDSVVVYTNIQDPKGAKWSVFYASTAPNGTVSGFTWEGRHGAVTADADGVITLSDTPFTETQAKKLLKASKLPAKGTSSFEYSDEDEDKAGNQVSFGGSFHGVAGTYKCDGSAACQVGHSTAGAITFSSGTWTFTPTSTDSMVAGVRTDADYIDFGYWVQTDMSGDTDSYKVAAFHRGSIQSDISNLSGKATYNGGAAGLYTKREFAAGGGGALLDAGRFTADAELTAYFGTPNTIASADHNSISGTISGFKDAQGNVIDSSWTLKLNPIGGSRTGAAGTFGAAPSGGTTTGGGAWDARFYGTADNTTTPHTFPTGVAGKFDGSFDNGRVVGSFGATR